MVWCLRTLISLPGNQVQFLAPTWHLRAVFISGYRESNTLTQTQANTIAHVKQTYRKLCLNNKAFKKEYALKLSRKASLSIMTNLSYKSVVLYENQFPKQTHVKQFL